MSGDNYLKQIADAYSVYARKYVPFEFKGQDRIPHNPKHNHRTKPKRKKK